MMETLLAASMAEMLQDAELWGGDGLMPLRLEAGDPECRVVLATGPNACGKSFACRFLAMTLAALRKEREGEKSGEFFHIGMRMRTENGGYIGPKTFVYGDEQDDSTGAASLRAVNGMLRQSEKRARHVVALDEPDIGLADEYALALGDKIRGFAEALPQSCDALVVVSHNRALISRLMGLRPHCLRFGPLSTQEWLDTPAAAVSVEELDSLADRNLQTFRAVGRLMDARRAGSGTRR